MDDPPMSEVILGGCVPLTPCLPPQVQPCLRRAVPKKSGNLDQVERCMFDVGALQDGNRWLKDIPWPTSSFIHFNTEFLESYHVISQILDEASLKVVSLPHD